MQSCEKSTYSKTFEPLSCPHPKDNRPKLTGYGLISMSWMFLRFVFFFQIDPNTCISLPCSFRGQLFCPLDRVCEIVFASIGGDAGVYISLSGGGGKG